MSYTKVHQHSNILLLLFIANNQLSIRNVEACISFDKSGNSQLNVGWDSVSTVIISYLSTMC